MTTYRTLDNTSVFDDRIIRIELLRLHWLGYFGARALAVVGVLAFVVLTSAVAVLTMNRVAVILLGVVTMLCVGLSLLGSALTLNQHILIYQEDGLYIAAHQRTGEVRHGQTPEEALSNLQIAREWARANQ